MRNACPATAGGVMNSGSRPRGATGAIAVIAFVIAGSVLAGVLSALWFFDWFSGREPVPPENSADYPGWELQRLFLSGLVGAGVAFVAFGVLNAVVTLVTAVRRRRSSRRPA